MNRLLIDDYPILVLPKLAVKIGLNEAIFVQQLHYWVNGKNGKTRDSKKWVYNTYDEWQEQFPFWSNSTLRRIIKSCEEQGIVITGNFNKIGIDRTKWYTVNYETISNMTRPTSQFEQSICSKWTDETGQNDHMDVAKMTTPITRDYPETTSETTTDILSGKPDQAPGKPYKEIINHLNDKTGKNYKAGSKATQRLIDARLNEGFTANDFKKVIDNKVATWKGDAKMEKYLRPQTLFGTKFESYLNEEVNNARGEYYQDLGF